MNQNYNSIQHKQSYIANLIKNYRINEGFSQEELSEYSDLHYNTIYRLESGLSVSFLTILKVAEALDFPLYELFLEID